MRLIRAAAVVMTLLVVGILIPISVGASHCTPPAITTPPIAGNSVGVLGSQKILVFTYHGFYQEGIGGARQVGFNPAALPCNVWVNGQESADTRIIDPDVASLAVRVILAPGDVGFEDADFVGKICGSGFGFEDCTITGSLATGGNDTSLILTSSSATSQVFDSPTEWVNTLGASGCFTALVSTNETNDLDEDGNPRVTYELQTQYRTIDSSCP